MPSFHTRIDLYGANPYDYAALHATMQAQGFSRKALPSAPRFYASSAAQYAYDTDLGGVAERERINALAMHAVNTLGRLGSIVTVERDAREALTV